jgi:hypothetical protein
MTPVDRLPSDCCPRTGHRSMHEGAWIQRRRRHSCSRSQTCTPSRLILAMTAPRFSCVVETILSRHFRKVAAASAVLSLPTRTKSFVPPSISTRSASGGCVHREILQSNGDARLHRSIPRLECPVKVIVVPLYSDAGCEEDSRKLTSQIPVRKEYDLRLLAHMRERP